MTRITEPASCNKESIRDGGGRLENWNGIRNFMEIQAGMPACWHCATYKDAEYAFSCHDGRPDAYAVSGQLFADVGRHAMSGLMYTVISSEDQSQLRRPSTRNQKPGSMLTSYMPSETSSN
jgi:hypothetical protein